jgi:DNA-binding LacI/PurR family transcriptional regulator
VGYIWNFLVVIHMASRLETNRQSEQLKRALRESCRNGALSAGSPAPSLRQLADEYRLSKTVIARSLQDLVDEGLFHTVPRVGTFVGRSRGERSDGYFLIALNNGTVNFANHRAMMTGLEDMLASHGAAVLSLEEEAALALHESGELPAVRGVFDLAWAPDEQGGVSWVSRLVAGGVPRVRFGTRLEDEVYDCVSFDDREGGARATRHLLENGHRHIAFLGLHAPDRAGLLEWSREREIGWCNALQSAGLSCDGLAFHPGREPENLNEADEIRVARHAAAAIVRRAEISAVVAANDHAALGLLRTLRAARIAPERWPAIVGFDNAPDVAGQLVTSLRLPWEDLGRAAADLLWLRAHEGVAGPRQHRTVSMKLIPRLTSRAAWTTQTGGTALAATM